MSAHDANRRDLSTVFAHLRAVLEPYIPAMQAMQDNPRGLYLNTTALMRNRQPLFFAAVMLTAEHVAFYVQAVEMYPDLLEAYGSLADRLEGLSCFTFTSVTDEEVAAMRELVRAGYERLKANRDL